jgi:exopolyphosphatase / guanosine-5'-triphosphate,3'-diphosphate pyrophosphatase
VRWEWRTFGDRLEAAETRLRALGPEPARESDETYLLSPESRDAVKVRNGLMDIKHLEQVNRDGLELWRPVMKSQLPISTADARAVLATLNLEAPPLELDWYEIADLAGAATAMTLVPVHKRRRHYTFHGCMAELTDLRTAKGSTRTIAVESEDPARVTDAVRELGLDSRPNVSVPAALAALV